MLDQEYDKQTALMNMNVLAKELRELEIKQREKRLEYWRWQAKAYPVYECNHPDNYACKNCLPTREDEPNE